jgi:uncharacterized protein (TIGR00299 family) protein
VAFHEVGAFDSIADVVGAAAALAWLRPVSVTSTPPVLGSGVVWTAHGQVPVPAPATAALLQGIPVRSEGKSELTTPTGAAILAAVVNGFREPPPIRLRAQGFGAGTREMDDRPNVLRVLLGDPIGQAHAASPADVTLLQTNLDDMNPQLVEPLSAALFEAGALDVWTTAVVMKKGRPGLEVSALAPEARVAAVTSAFFENSPTLGVRRIACARTVLARATERVQTRFGEIAIKIAVREGHMMGATPEFEDCRRLASHARVPVRLVLAEATAAATALHRKASATRTQRRGGRAKGS